MIGARQVALQILLQVVEQGKPLDAVTDSEWYRTLPLQSRDLAFARELANGVCRWFFLLQHIANQYLKKPMRARDRDVELILLLGLYQLLGIQTGQHAAVNETVQLTVKRKKAWARGVINAVLRNVIRGVEQLENYDPLLSYPSWMQRQIAEDWGDNAASVLVAGNQRAPMILRFDNSRLTAEQALGRLREAGIPAVQHELVASALVLEQAVAIDQIPGFSEGWFSVQDAAAQLAAPLLDVQPGMRVLDLCAAPGGKSLHLAQLIPDIKLSLLDVSASRLQRVTQNLQRAGVAAEVITGDAAQPEGWWSGESYDRILADVPCTATGVIRRHPDIKIHRKPEDVLRLCDSQRKILHAAWSMLKPGGQMLYSTCSILRQENEAQMLTFIDQQADCEEVLLPEVNWGERCVTGYRIAPGSHDMDGFYYACLRKVVR